MPPAKAQVRILPQIGTLVVGVMLVSSSYYAAHWRMKDVRISPANSMPGMNDGARFISIGAAARLPGLRINDRVLVTNQIAGGDYVARVIALPGQKIRQTMRDYFVDDAPEVRDLTTPYQKPTGGTDFDNLVVPIDCVFLLIDDRSKKSANDSRRLGPIPHHLIVGVMRW